MPVFAGRGCVFYCSLLDVCDGIVGFLVNVVVVCEWLLHVQRGL